MVDWLSPQEIAKDGVVFSRLQHCLIGLYLWEFVTSLSFDFSFVSGMRVFKWPLIFYFAGRYSILFAFIGVLIALNVTVEIDCQALYIFNQVFGNAAIGFASINLSLRTIAIWSQSVYIIALLVLVILGHWSLLLHGLLISAAWVEPAGCVITKTDSKMLAATFIYTMAFDFTVLSLTAYKLIFPCTGRSKLAHLIFKDGLIYFIVAFLANLIATVFMLLNLNPIMSIVFNVPAAVSSTIVASRAVRRLVDFGSNKQPEVFTDGFATSNRKTGRRLVRPVSESFESKDGLHIEMDSIMLDDSSLGLDSFIRQGGISPISEGRSSILHGVERRS